MNKPKYSPAPSQLRELETQAKAIAANAWHDLRIAVKVKLRAPDYKISWSDYEAKTDTVKVWASPSGGYNVYLGSFCFATNVLTPCKAWE
jgi:hypothetical protein